MTNAYPWMHGRSLASMLDASVTGTVDRLRAAWTNYRTYRKTLAELRDLPTRALRDLDPAAETEPERTLTMAHAIHLNAYADYAEQPGIFARLRQAFADRKYLAIYNEINVLSDRELADLDLSRLNVRDVARDAIYGN